MDSSPGRSSGLLDSFCLSSPCRGKKLNNWQVADLSFCNLGPQKLCQMFNVRSDVRSFATGKCQIRCHESEVMLDKMSESMSDQMSEETEDRYQIRCLKRYMRFIFRYDVRSHVRLGCQNLRRNLMLSIDGRINGQNKRQMTKCQKPFEQ